MQSVQNAYLTRAEALALPSNPLDTIIERLGGGAVVAEMTGRKFRLQRAVGGGSGVSLTKRSSGAAATAADAVESINVRERKYAFLCEKRDRAIAFHACSIALRMLRVLGHHASNALPSPVG